MTDMYHEIKALSDISDLATYGPNLFLNPSLTHDGMKLSGNTSSGRSHSGKLYDSFSEALEECLKHPLSGGITKCPNTNCFTVRAGSTLTKSHLGEVSWLKAEILAALEKAKEENSEDDSSLPEDIKIENDKPTGVLIREMILEKISNNEKEMSRLEESIADERAIIAEKELSICGTTSEISRHSEEVEYLKKQLVILGNVDKLGKELSDPIISECHDESCPYDDPYAFQSVTDKWIVVVGADSMEGENAGPEPSGNLSGYHRLAPEGWTPITVPAAHRPKKTITSAQAHHHCSANNLRGFCSVVGGSIYWRDSSQKELVENLHNDRPYRSNLHIAPGAPVSLLKQKEKEGFTILW